MIDHDRLIWGECPRCGSPLVHAEAALLRPGLCPACNEAREEEIFALIVGRLERALGKLGWSGPDDATFPVSAGVVRRARGDLLRLRRALMEGMPLSNERKDTDEPDDDGGQRYA